MKTPSWQVAGAEVQSAQFPGFIIPSRCLFFPLSTSLFRKVDKSLQLVPTTPSTLPGSSLPHFLITLYQHQTCDLVMTFKVSNSLFPASLSSSQSTFLCLLKDFGLKIYFQVANPTMFDFCTRLMASSCALWYICVENNL